MFLPYTQRMMIIGIIINKGMNRSGGHLWSDTYVYGVDCGDGFMGVICLHTHKVACINHVQLSVCQ